jgi:hypothetical protein
MDLVCQKLNCKLEFYIGNADPHYWESQEKALCAGASFHSHVDKALSGPKKALYGSITP